MHFLRRLPPLNLTRRPWTGQSCRPFTVSRPRLRSHKNSTPFHFSGATEKKRITVQTNATFVSMDHIFLRDACQCPRCIDPSTRQKLFQTSDIPLEVCPRVAETLENQSLRIVWENDIPDIGNPEEPHESIYDAEFLYQYSNLRHRVRKRFNDQSQILWDGNIMQKNNLWLDYREYMDSDETLYQALLHLNRYGLIFLRGVPDGKENDAVVGLAERIGNLKNTFYGQTWDVKSVKNAKNIAYTSLNLGLHMDLLYFESPPGVQLLHCLRNSTTGGSSVFADSFRAATSVRMNSENHFRALKNFPVTYHYQNDNHHYHFIRPTVVLDETSYQTSKRISHINWAPPFQGPFEIDIGSDPTTSSFRMYITAIKEFARALEDPAVQFELTLKQGECAVFLNRRVVHARRAFDPASGERWLKGAYVDGDAFRSKVRVLSERFRKEKPMEEEERLSYIR